MKERPILFNGDMVRAILHGRKTQTRRPVKNQKHPHGTWATPDEVAAEFLGGTCAFSPPLGTVGDRLWVRETYAWVHPGMLQSLDPDPNSDQWGAIYKADNQITPWSQRVVECAGWRPSIHMKREHSRIDLEITRVWVERVQDITEEDAKAEGVEYGIWHQKPGVFHEPTDEVDVKNGSYKAGFGFLWQSIYGTWDANPWVWAYEFRRIKP